MSRHPRPRWTADDRFRFATQRLRARTQPARRPTGPTAAEWDTHEEGDPATIPTTTAPATGPQPAPATGHATGLDPAAE